MFGPKAKDNEEIRGLLNAGHRKGAVAGRCVVRGKEVFTEELPAYCAVAMAGLGYLPDTILTRSVIVNMRRRAPNETVEPYRRRLEVEKGGALRRRLEVWASTISGAGAGRVARNARWYYRPKRGRMGSPAFDSRCGWWRMAQLGLVSRLSRLSRFSGVGRGAWASDCLPTFAPYSVTGMRYAPKTCSMRLSIWRSSFGRTSGENH